MRDRLKEIQARAAKAQHGLLGWGKDLEAAGVSTLLEDVPWLLALLERYEEALSDARRVDPRSQAAY